MADLDDTVTQEDVEEFRKAVKMARREMPMKQRPSKESLELEPEINGNRRVIAQCKVTQSGTTVTDNENMLFAEKDLDKTACGNAIKDFKHQVKESTTDLK